MRPKNKTLKAIKIFCIFTKINYEDLLPIKTEKDAQKIIEIFNGQSKQEKIKNAKYS